MLVRAKVSPMPTLKIPEMTVDILPQRMPVRWNAVAVRHLQTDCVVAAGSRRVAFEHGANCAPGGTNGGAGPHCVSSVGPVEVEEDCAETLRN